MKKMELEFHPLADIFPALLGHALGELAADIRDNGLQQPIVTVEGKILDGHNRYQACKIAGRQAKI
jgi:ParB-like chromosome segregation protein Spo0J